jgi:hypothetical protein
MSDAETHEQFREVLAAEALHPSSGAEGEAVRVHIANCESCAAELAAYRDAAAHLAFLAPLQAMPPSREQLVRERLLARATGLGGAADPGREIARE